MPRAPIALRTLVLTAIAAAVLASAFWLLDLLPIPPVDDRATGLGPWLFDNRVRLCALGLPVLGGMAVSLYAERRIKRGLASGRWPKAEIEAVHELLARRGWIRTLFAYAILALAVPSLSRHHFLAGSVAVAFLPTQVFSRLRSLLSPVPRVRTHYTPPDWTEFKPIHSSHWGEPPHPHGD